MRDQHFIGYATLEKLAQAMDVKQTVYATAVQNPGKVDKHGMYICKAEIVVEQIDESGDVHYCLIPMGRYTVLIHAPNFDSNKKRIITLQQQALSLVNDWLSGVMGFTVREAQISKPENLRLCEGWFNALAYDKASGSFRLEYPEQTIAANADDVGVFAASDQLVTSKPPPPLPDER